MYQLDLWFVLDQRKNYKVFSYPDDAKIVISFRAQALWLGKTTATKTPTVLICLGIGVFVPCSARQQNNLICSVNRMNVVSTSRLGSRNVCYLIWDFMIKVCKSLKPQKDLRVQKNRLSLPLAKWIAMFCLKQRLLKKISSGGIPNSSSLMPCLTTWAHSCSAVVLPMRTMLSPKGVQKQSHGCSCQGCKATNHS